ncbi:MAG: hypothetical protein P8R54_30005 [Myxococcota bacterium]|nr:hypothetical protein [Myxococcota bacterium]
MRQWLLVSAVLSGCLSDAPTELEGELGFTVQDALLVPCTTASGEQMMFGLVRAPDGCQDAAPRRRTCEGMTSLLSYPFACQTGAIPMTLTSSDAILVWISGADDLSTATLTAVERRGCRRGSRTLTSDSLSLSQRNAHTVLTFQGEELSGAVALTVCR